MVQSMTAFARVADQGDWGQAVWELRCVNHRYLDISMKMPEAFRGIEMTLRETLRSRVGRGKLECFLRYQVSDKTPHALTLNTSLVNQLISLHDEVGSLTPSAATLNPMDILAWPEVVNNQGADASAAQTAIKALFERAIEEFLATRAREGNALATLVEEKLQSVASIVEQVRTLAPAVLNAHQQKLKDRLSEVMDQLDPARLEQEMVLLAHRLDVAEEMDRLATHVKEVARVLKQGGAVGRRLDFLMQEMNREANTLSSKSPDAQLTQFSIELKVLIEQMREQIQNIE